MDRNFILAGSFAIALHGALFSLPGGAPAIRIADPFPYIEVKRPPFDLPPEPPTNVVENSNVPQGGAPDETRRQVDEPKIDPRDGIEIPVEAYVPPPTKPGPMLTPGPFGTGEPIGVPNGQPISPGQLDRTPRARVQVSPEYPTAARSDGRSGVVTVEFIVDEGGRVYDAHVIDSSDRVFNEAAVRAVGKWRFEPGTVHGKVVRFRMAVPVVFHLET